MEQQSNRVWSKVETITPQIAQEYLAMNVINRPLHTAKVTEYADAMLRGQWQLNGESICFDVKGHMVNGQHRLNAVIEASKQNPNISFQTVVVRGVSEDSFLTFDSGLGRKVTDVFSLTDVPNYTNAAALVKRLLIWRAAGTTSAGRIARSAKCITKQDCLEEYISNDDFYQKAIKYSASTNQKIKRLLTDTELAAIYVWLIVDCHHKEDIVKNFFDSMFSYTNSPCNAINLLRARLIEDASNPKRKMPKLYKWMIIVKAWNAYITNKDLKRFLSWSEDKDGRLDFI